MSAARSSWPPRWSDHVEGDVGCLCAACSHYRRIQSLAFLDRYSAAHLAVSNDVAELEPEPFDWNEPMPPAESELSGNEPGYATLPERRFRHG